MFLSGKRRIVVGVSSSSFKVRQSYLFRNFVSEGFIGIISIRRYFSVSISHQFLIIDDIVESTFSAEFEIVSIILRQELFCDNLFLFGKHFFWIVEHMKDFSFKVLNSMLFDSSSQQFPGAEIAVIKITGLMATNVEFAIDLVCRLVNSVEHKIPYSTSI